MAKAKANAAQAIPELIRIATNAKHEVNRHADDGKKYLYDVLSIKKETSSPLE